MKMYTQAFNEMRELNTFVNKNDIDQDRIVQIFQSTDGLFYLVYYSE